MPPPAASIPLPDRLRPVRTIASGGMATVCEAEDTLLYPILIERAPEQAGTTADVAHEHELVHTAIDATTSACAAWRHQPSAETGEALAVSLEQLDAELRPHLDDEEAKVVPLAAATLTQVEWDAMGEHARTRVTFTPTAGYTWLVDRGKVPAPAGAGSGV